MTQVVVPQAGPDKSPFEALRHIEPDGSERWYGRELMPVMDYSRWERFAAVVNKAKASLALVQGPEAAEHHFPMWGSDGGRWEGAKVADFRLTRFGAYLTAMAGDDTKEAVAHARVYFAVQTRKAEVAEHAPAKPAAEVTRRELALMILEAEDRADAAEAVAAERGKELEAAGPKVAQAEHHRAADDLMAVGTFANTLKAWAKREHGVRVKHEQVWDFLGDIGLLIRGNTLRNNHPTAFAVERDFVRVKTTEFETNTRGVQASHSPRLTAAGEGWAWDRAVTRITRHGSLTTTKAIEGASA